MAKNLDREGNGMEQQHQLALPAPSGKAAFQADRKDFLLLPLAWLLGIWFIHLSATLLELGLPGLGLTLFVAACYLVLFWYTGKHRALSGGNRFLLVVQGLLAASLSISSNYPLRLLNCFAICLLAAVQLFQQCGIARHAWTKAGVLTESVGLALQGLFGRIDRPFRVLASGRGKGSKRMLSVLLALLIAVPLLAVILPLLLSADVVFDRMLSGVYDFLAAHCATGLSRVVLGAFLGVFLYGLIYFLRHGKEEKPGAAQPASAKGKALRIDALVLALLAALYLLFLGVQWAVLFGGTRYLRAAGVSYAQYARSGFFQLVAVAAINLTVLLAALQFCRPGKGRRAVQVLGTLLVGESAVLLFSAAWRMSLYVAVYGLTRLRAVTYWGIALLAVFFVAALWKIWKPRFGFFKVFFAAGLIGWTALNLVSMDSIIAHYNVEQYLTGRLQSVDVIYLSDLSYDALPALERLPGSMVVYEYEDWDAAEEGQVLRQVTVADRIAYRRVTAAATARHWESWNLSAALAAADIDK